MHAQSYKNGFTRGILDIKGRLEGVYPAMPTPFDERAKVNEAELRKYVGWLIQKGVNGLFPLGSVGEFIHMDDDEKIKVMEIILDEANGRVPVTPGTAGSCAGNSIRLTKAARDMGCQAAVIAPPYYFPVSEELIEKHFEQIARSVPDFPIILYNIPLFSDPIGYDVLKRLCRIQNIVGMKDSSGSMVDLLHFMDKVRIAGESINIMTGREEMLLAALMMGANGTMSGTVGILPEKMKQIYDLWCKGDFEQARKVQFSLLLLIRTMMSSLPFPLGFKVALDERGFDFGPPRQPLSNAEQYNYLKIKSRISKIMQDMLGNELKAVRG